MRQRSLSSSGLGMLLLLPGVWMLGVWGAATASADDGAARKQEEQAIRTTAKAYLAALAKGDSKAAAEFWTADGCYFDEQGVAHPIKSAVAESESAASQTPPPENKVTTSTIRFLTADVAIEDGTSEVVARDGHDSTASRGQYHAVWVKRAGEWRLASLSESPIVAAAVPQLSDMSWMVGTWVADSGGTKVESTTRWNATGTFLLRDMKATREGQVVLRGSQRTGWDPLARKLVSWTFDSDGGHGEVTWTKQGDAWIGQATGVMADGRPTASTTVITYDGKDSYTRQTVAARVDGDPITDQQVRFTRQASATR